MAPGAAEERDRAIDPLDQAADRAAELCEDALAEHRRAHPVLPDHEWEQHSAKWCESCGERIPDARRRAVVGVQRCVECQSIEEGRPHDHRF